MKKQFLVIFIIYSNICFSQDNSNELNMDPVDTSWLQPYEMHLELKEVVRKVPGANRGGNWEVDGFTYQSPPVIYASQVKYIEVVSDFVQANTCRCNLIVKTIVTNKELNSRKNELNRLNKRGKQAKPKKKKKKKKK